jgi:hypothetical protein
MYQSAFGPKSLLLSLNGRKAWVTYTRIIISWFLTSSVVSLHNSQPFLVNFSHVCPEPVLANMQFLV